MCILTYLVSLFTAWDRAGKGLLVSSVHAHGTEDGLRADGALCSPWFITVRLLKVYLLFITLATCGGVKDRKSNSKWLRASLLDMWSSYKLVSKKLWFMHTLWLMSGDENPGLWGLQAEKRRLFSACFFGSVPIISTSYVTVPKFLQRLIYANCGKEFIHFTEVLGSMCSIVLQIN